MLKKESYGTCNCLTFLSLIGFVQPMGMERYSQGATCWDAKRRSRIKTGRIYHISSHRRQQLLIHEENIMSFVHKCKCICCQILQLLYFYVRIPGSCPLDIGCGSDEGGTSKGQMHRIHLWHAVTTMWYVQIWAKRWAFFSCEIFLSCPAWLLLAKICCPFMWSQHHAFLLSPSYGWVRSGSGSRAPD